jgi:hypothetical protein
MTGTTRDRHWQTRKSSFETAPRPLWTLSVLWPIILFALVSLFPGAKSQPQRDSDVRGAGTGDGGPPVGSRSTLLLLSRAESVEEDDSGGGDGTDDETPL